MELAKFARRAVIVGGTAAMIALALLAGCGDDKPSDSGTVAAPSRGTPDSLLTSWLVNAHSKKDSGAYDAALDSEFTFEFLSEVSDAICQARPLACDFKPLQFFRRTNDLRSVGRMFLRTDIGTIRLQISTQPDVEYTGSDCIGCRELDANIMLEVTIDPTAPDPLVVTVNSPQFFIVKPDPADPEQWVLFRQIDMPPPSAKRGGAAQPASVEASSWSRVKAYFGGYLDSPVGEL